MTTTKITRAYDDSGLEFFTLDATGESGMSQTALAVLCGVSQSAISQLISGLISKSPSKGLEPFAGKALTLISKSSNHNITVYKAEFCFTVLTYYAFKGNETAQLSMMKFGAMGINQWIQGVTNYTPKELMEPANPLMIDVIAWRKHRERGTMTRSTYQKFVMANGGNIALWTNWGYEKFFGLKASEIKDAMEKVRGNQQVARNYLAYTRHLCIIEHFEFMVLQLHRQDGSTDLDELHNLAARNTYEKFRRDDYCLV